MALNVEWTSMYTTICHILYCHKCVMVYTCHGCNDSTNWKYILHMACDSFNHLSHILVINRTEETTRNAAVTSVSDKWITLWWYHYCPLYFYFIRTLTWFDITTHPSRLEPESPFFSHGPRVNELVCLGCIGLRYNQCNAHVDSLAHVRWALIRGYPAKRALSAMRKHGG